MIIPPSLRSCIECLARPVPPPRLSNYEMQLVHFWHQTLGCNFACAAFRALGEIAAVAAELNVPVDPSCAICQRAWATPFAGILLDLEAKLRQCTPWPDRSALHQALSARNAAIEGDSEGVDLFSGSWLKLDRPAAWRPAVEMALLGDWVGALGNGTAHTPALVDRLRRDARTEHRHLQPLWERKAGGTRTVLLSTPVGDGLVVGDLLATSATPEDTVLSHEFTDLRIPAVLRRLRPPEERVALQWARPGTTSWAEAATRAIAHDAAKLTGFDPFALGERVRRKLRRLGDSHTARTTAAKAASR
ncbi:hypothetical protein [Streptomyces sp. NPDC088762]|uniref:hypothetical protein n=1 Tax=Streptomyces sp. NPDC088762 TaxID=3365891 RepID=UPI0037F2001B